MLLKVLRYVEEAKVKMPTNEEVTTYTEMVAQKYPSLNDCWGAMDGLKVGVECAGDEVTQNRFYNGWKCDHYISNVFLFSPAGKICAVYFNAPGIVHDSVQWPRCPEFMIRLMMCTEGLEQESSWTLHSAKMIGTH